MIMHVIGAADAVARLHVEADAMSLFEHHRSRPDLNVHLDHLAGRKVKSPLVAMSGSIRQRELLVELAMRPAQPPLRPRPRPPLLTGLEHVAPVRRDVADGEE